MHTVRVYHYIISDVFWKTLFIVLGLPMQMSKDFLRDYYTPYGERFV